jgi:hypothetical protein
MPDENPVTDPRDVRTLIPRVRRSTSVPGVESPAVPDDELAGAIADAAGEIIMLTGGTFGVTLETTSRDDKYLAANAWAFSVELSSDQETVVCAQAAISQLARRLALAKTSEEIKDEGQSWSYQHSATLQRDLLKNLIAMRDRALDDLASAGVETEIYSSFVGIRDSEAVANAEAWAAGAA